MKIVLRNLVRILTVVVLNLPATAFASENIQTTADSQPAREQTQAASDVRSVPVAAMIWLAGTALIGLVALRRRAKSGAEQSS